MASGGTEFIKLIILLLTGTDETATSRTPLLGSLGSLQVSIEVTAPVIMDLTKDTQPLRAFCIVKRVCFFSLGSCSQVFMAFACTAGE